MITREAFEKSLKTPIDCWGQLSPAAVENLLNKEVAKMVGFDQNNPHHCHDLFMHTLYTVASLPENASSLLRCAAFFHDIGKPVVAKEKNGRKVFYGHASQSEKIARKILKKLHYSESEIEEICFYIVHHDDFISWVLPTETYDSNNQYMIPITIENMEKHFEKAKKKEPLLNRNELSEKEVWMKLLQLCCADVEAQAENVFANGKLKDSKKHKLEKLVLIKDLMQSM